VVAALLALSAMPGRADFVQRWDAIKKYKNPCSTIPSSSSSPESGGSPSRADTIDRWDANKKYEIRGGATSSSSSSESGGSPGRADTVDRWDSKKLKTSNRTSPTTDRGRLQDGINKRLASRASSAERWDLHKKHHPEEKGNLPQTEQTTTAAAHKDTARMQQAAIQPCSPCLPSFCGRTRCSLIDRDVVLRFGTNALYHYQCFGLTPIIVILLQNHELICTQQHLIDTFGLEIVAFDAN
jgi:hypothetical protein